jgi:hypothetical protein
MRSSRLGQPALLVLDVIDLSKRKKIEHAVSGAIAAYRWADSNARQ